ncbi:hypothetical protein Tco_1116224 [Tanacetum coccineum]
MFAVCACARYQVNPKVLHLHAVKRNFRYLKGQPKLGLWYPKDYPFDLVAYTDSDYVLASLDRKSTTGGCQFLRCRLISWQCKKHTVVENSTTEAEYMAALSCCGQVKMVNGEVQLQALVDGKKIVVTEASVRSDLQLDDEEGKGFSGRVTPLFPTMVVQAQEEMGEGSANLTDPYHTSTIIQPSTSQLQKKQRSRRSKRKDTKVPQPGGATTNVTDEDVNKDMDDSLVRATTTASSLEADSGGGPKCQETMGDTIAQTRSENVSKLSNDPLLARGNTLQSGEDSLKLKELMELCTNLQNKVIDLEKTKTSQA